jgi:hypothetical protein
MKLWSTARISWTNKRIVDPRQLHRQVEQVISVELVQKEWYVRRVFIWAAVKLPPWSLT